MNRRFILTAVTDSRLLPEGTTLMERIGMLCDAGVGRIVLREKGMPDDAYSEAARGFIAVCRERCVIPVINHRPDIAEALGVDDIQISIDELRDDPGITGRFRRVGVSVHSVDEAVEAESLGAESVTAGHIFPTVCKKGVPQRGTRFLMDAVASVDIPVYAIGGIDADVIEKVRSCGAAGVCLMSVMMGSPEDHIRRLAQICYDINRPIFLRDTLRLYAVTDRQWLRPGESLAQRVLAAVLGGVTAVQIREKGMPSDLVAEETRRCMRVCRQFGVPVFVNDDVAAAIEAGADGVHLGQDDMPASMARASFDGIIGVSASTPEEARKAEADGADYIGCGAVFPTSTKSDADDMGISGLRRIRMSTGMPIVAIGGITSENIGELRDTGIDGVAVVSAVFRPEDSESAAERLSDALGSIGL